MGVDKSVLGIEVEDQIYVRNNAAHMLGVIIHEGTHALDFNSGYGEEGLSCWSWEKRAYFYERQFLLAIGDEVEFPTINEMLVHIWRHYKNEIYYPYNKNVRDI